jgi:hypothetical protein
MAIGLDKRIVISRTCVAISLLAAMALLSLTSCGGGAPKESTMGITVTASFAGATMPSAVAYQAGTTGTFQPLNLSGTSVSFTLPSGTTAYGFAYMCPTFLNVASFSNETVIQATTADTTSLSLACPSLAGNISATFDVSAIPDVTSTSLCVGDWSNEMYGAGTSGVQGLSGVPTGTLDVALVAEGKNGALGIQIQRGVHVTSSTSIAFPPMSAEDELGTAPVEVTNVPPGAAAGFETTYQTSGGLSVTLPVLSNGAPQSTYPTVPGAQSQPGDFYLIHAGAMVSAQSISSLMSFRTAGPAILALPAPSNSLAAPVAAAFPTLNANFRGFSVEGPIVESAWTQFQTANDNYTVHNLYAFVTKAWLGSNTTFTVPDLSSLPEFAPAPPSGAKEFWSLYSTAGTPLQFNSLQQSGPPMYSSPTSLQSISTGGAFNVP